jgi:hypothetical protein
VSDIVVKLIYCLYIEQFIRGSVSLPRSRLCGPQHDTATALVPPGPLRQSQPITTPTTFIDIISTLKRHGQVPPAIYHIFSYITSGRKYVDVTVAFTLVRDPSTQFITAIIHFDAGRFQL